MIKLGDIVRVKPDFTIPTHALDGALRHNVQYAVVETFASSKNFNAGTIFRDDIKVKSLWTGQPAGAWPREWFEKIDQFTAEQREQAVKKTVESLRRAYKMVS